MALAWEFVYNGLVMGGDGTYPITDVEGLSPPDPRIDSITKSIEHGAFIYAQYLSERRITIEGFCLQNSADALVTAMNTFKSKVVPQRVILPLTFKQGNDIEKRIYCIPIKHASPYDLHTSLGFTEWTQQFLAGDPRIYAEASTSLVGSGTAVNAGSFPTYPQATIVGPATNPRIFNSTTSEALQVNVTVASGQELIIDFDERTVMLAGISKYDKLSLASVWWDIEPGNNAITYTGGGTCTLTWRSAWL